MSRSVAKGRRYFQPACGRAPRHQPGLRRRTGHQQAAAHWFWAVPVEEPHSRLWWPDL